MPRGDRTGPMGAGVKSGRALGYCAGFGLPGLANPSMAGTHGKVMYRNRSRRCLQPAGRSGRRRWNFAVGRPGGESYSGDPFMPQPIDPEREKEALRNRGQVLQAELDTVNRRLEEMADQEKAP